MSFEERHTWAGTVIGLAAIIAYVVVIAGRARDAALTDLAWGWPMLVTVLIAGGLYGLVYLGLRLRHRGEPIADARDIEIDRYAELAGKGLVSATVTAAIVMLALNVDTFWVAHTLFAGAYLSSLVVTLTKLAVYRSGLPS